MYSALPPDPGERHATIDLFFTLTALIQEAGGQVEYGDTDDLACWDAHTATLTLRAADDPDEHTWALAEFCRHLTLGASQFIDGARRHLHAVS